MSPEDEEAVSAALVGFVPDAMAGLHAFIEDQVAAAAAEYVDDPDEVELLAGRGLADYLYGYLEDSDQRLAERVHRALPESVTVSQAAELFVSLAKRTG